MDAAPGQSRARPLITRKWLFKYIHPLSIEESYSSDLVWYQSLILTSNLITLDVFPKQGSKLHQTQKTGRKGAPQHLKLNGRVSKLVGR